MTNKTILIHNNHGARDLLPRIGEYLKSKGFYIIFIVKTKQDISFIKKSNFNFFMK